MGDWYSIEGIGDVSQLVGRAPAFDPRLHDGFRPEYYSLWNRIGSDTTVKDLLMCGDVTPSHALLILRSLIEVGAVKLRPATKDDDFEIVDQTELGALTSDEDELLRQEVDLAPWEKRRILAVARVMEAGELFELLGVTPNASKRELKRAYYSLSKEFHPDRYFGKQLGGFKTLLERIFETAGGAVKTLSDSRTVVPSGMQTSQRRRRGSERYPYSTRVLVRCSSWSEVRELFTQDVSAGGMFVPSDAAATAGERVALEVTLPDGAALRLRGTVVAARGPVEASRDRRGPGLGIKLDALPPPAMERFAQLLTAAREGVPAPSAAPEPQPRRRLARGTRPVPRQTPILGIDLGTSYTSISAAVDDHVSVLSWPNGMPCIPSVVGFPSRGTHIVGHAARDRLLTDPRHTVPAAKRLIGRRADDRELEAHLAQAAYDTRTADDGSVLIDMWGEPYAIPQICSYLFAAAKEAAERALGCPVDRAVVTVPVSFTDERVELMRIAGRLAHLDVVEVIDEPSAAALANRYRPSFGGLIGVYDFGGGTFDFSVVDASGGDFRVLATAGDSWLGGDDLDFAVAEAVANKFWRVHGVDLRNRAVEWQQLLFQCELAKRRLSSQREAHIAIPEAFRNAAGPVDLRMRLTREPVDRLFSEPIRRSLRTCHQALTLLGLQPSNLETIYLSGGTSYVPAVRRALHEQLRVPIRSGVPPEFAACLGAGIHAAQLERRVQTTLKGVA